MKITIGIPAFNEEEKLPEVQNFKMYYSLSKSYFDIDNKDLAFKYLELASNFKLREIENSYKKQSKDFKQIKEYFRTSKKTSEVSNNFKTTPIFILGMPRSGTSLIEQIISNHSSVHGGGELDILPLVVENSSWKKNQNFVDTIKFIRNEYCIQ